MYRPIRAANFADWLRDHTATPTIAENGTIVWAAVGIQYDLGSIFRQAKAVSKKGMGCRIPAMKMSQMTTSWTTGTMIVRMSIYLVHIAAERCLKQQIIVPIANAGSLAKTFLQSDNRYGS